MSSYEKSASVHRQRKQIKRSASALGTLMLSKPARVINAPAETVFCRCENVTRGEIDMAIESGAVSLNQLKHFTRCGMGPCQGRFCGEAAAEIMAARFGGREKVGYWTPRPPLRPVELQSIIGDFTYDDIPVPAPAPL